jgi:ABC-2 type transport system permease protein
VSGLRLATRQVRYENRAFWRNPAQAFFTFVFPLIFLVLFNLLFGEAPGASTFIVPAIAAFAIITATFTNLSISVSFLRDEGLLKRVRGTPLPGWAYLGGRVGHAVLLALLLLAIIIVVGAILYGVDIPTNTMPAVLLAVAAGAFAFSSLGLAMTAAIPNADAAPAVANAVILPLLFISDVFIDTADAPTWLRTVADLFPVKHLSQALHAAYEPGAVGAGIEWGHLGVVIAWGAAGLMLAVRFFSWEPRR